MEFSVKLHTIKSGWSIEYIEGSQVKIPKHVVLSLKIDFVLANRADSEEKQYYPFFLSASSLFTIVQLNLS